jgi:hypothetical protein
LHKSILYTICTSTLLCVLVSVIPFQAHGDGFSSENLPPASIGNRSASLFIKINPPVITSENTGDRYLLLRLFDANNNKTITHDSFFIEVRKHNQLLMQDLFHTHSGVLILKITPTSTIGKWDIYGDKEPFLDAWMNQEGGPVDVRAPILGEGGLYQIHIELFSIDYDKNIFKTEDRPRWDSGLSVGDINQNTINYKNHSYNTTLISYYDKITNFNFDQTKPQISFAMPFDWNASRFKAIPIFVHEEIHVPKSFKEFTNTPTFLANVNGNPLEGRKLLVDPYSSGNDTIIHILLNKNDIINLAKTMPAGTNTMNFQVSPGIPNVKTSTSILTDFGGWGINLGWFPASLSANEKNDLKLTFVDAFSEKPVSGNVNYDLKILDKDGNTILSEANLTAKNGADIQSMNLPSTGIYNIQVNIKSITSNGIADTSRIGIARGNLVIPSIAINEDVIPEFPTGIIVLLISISFIILISSSSRLKF